MPFYMIDPLPEYTRTVRIPIKDFARYERVLGRAIRQRVFSAAMPTAGKRVRIFLEEETQRRGIAWRKNFARSWRLQIGSPPSSVRVTNKTKYGIVIEKGRRAGARRPPAQALIPWVRDKLGLRGAQGRAAAFVIARRIGERGLPPRPVLGNPRVQERVQKIVTAAVIERLRETLQRAK